MCIVVVKSCAISVGLLVILVFVLCSVSVVYSMQNGYYLVFVQLLRVRILRMRAFAACSVRVLNDVMNSSPMCPETVK